jgi:hypothetical protein
MKNLLTFMLSPLLKKIHIKPDDDSRGRKEDAYM